MIKAATETAILKIAGKSDDFCSDWLVGFGRHFRVVLFHPPPELTQFCHILQDSFKSLKSLVAPNSTVKPFGFRL